MPLTKAWIINEDNIKGKVICLFNPEKYTISKSNSWKQEPIIGQDVPPGHFTGGCPRTMNMELFLIRREWIFGLISTNCGRSR